MFLGKLCVHLIAFMVPSIGQALRGCPVVSRPRDRVSFVLSASKLDKGFNLLEQRFIPQGPIVAAVKEGWKLVWQRMMAELAPQDKSGMYQRPSYDFDGEIARTQDFHVYLGEACPWCHRVKLTLLLKGIESVTVTQLLDDPTKASRGGWVFSQSDRDPLFTAPDLRGVYDLLCPGFEGRCTAPLLVDKRDKKIISNESSRICRILNSLEGTMILNLCPGDKVVTIDETNEWIYNLLNNAVYRCGFSTTQTAYDQASADVRLGLERANNLLANQSFLCGSAITESDVRLLPTVLRFDGVYAPLFRAGGAHLRIRDYENIHRWLKRCWKIPGVKQSIDLAKANASYYSNLFPLNPGGIVPSVVTSQGLGLE
jgi:putative glutathione S-transferase